MDELGWEPFPLKILKTDIDRYLDSDKDMVQIPRKEYEGLMNQVVEGFGNNVDEQFNQLLLYIFTGVFFVVMMDTMYQLGKKSY